MDAPVSTRQPMFFVPRSVLLLLAALVGVHMVRMWALSPEAGEDVMIRFAFLPIRYLPHIDGGAWWEKVVPFFSHQFLHSGWFHLIMNGAWVVACGPVVARRFGPWLFWAFFLICGVIGAAAFLGWFVWVNGGAGIDGMVGASGAVSGLMGASIRMMPSQTAFYALWARPQPLASLLSRPIVAFTAIWFVTNLIYAFTGFGAGMAVHQIAWQAHIGGFVAGLLLAGPFDFFAHRLIRG